MDKTVREYYQEKLSKYDDLNLRISELTKRVDVLNKYDSKISLEGNSLSYYFGNSERRTVLARKLAVLVEEEIVILKDELEVL